MRLSPSGPDSRFALEDVQGWKKHLDQRGFVVVQRVLKEPAVQKAKDLLWVYLEEQGMKQGEPESWDGDNYIGDSNTGICPLRGAPHSEFAWFVRSHPGVKRVFEGVWEEANLITSFDAINIFRPFVEKPQLKTKVATFNAFSFLITLQSDAASHRTVRACVCWKRGVGSIWIKIATLRA